MLFIDEASESQLEEVLRALVGEWGQDDVTISVPADWKEWFPELFSIGRVQVLFITYDMVSISVPKGNIHIDAQICTRAKKNSDDEWLQNYLFIFALRHLEKQGGCSDRSLIEQALVLEIQQFFKSVKVPVSDTDAQGIAHVIIVKLAARGLATGYSKLTVTDRGLSWLEARAWTSKGL